MHKLNPEKDEKLLEKRFVELSRIAYQREYVTFSDFLNLNEQNILNMLPKDKLFTKVMSFGGYETAERQMAAFIPEALSLRYGKEYWTDIGYPITILQISPISRRFAENLTHRDYLGSVLSLGIERCKIGDIITTGQDAYIFVQEDISDYIRNELSRIRHTSVQVSCTEMKTFHYEQKYEEIRGTVASVRLDSLLSIAFSSSRTKLTGLIENAKVFVNGRLITSNGYQPREGDIISVRGMGKFRYGGAGERTRKNRIPVIIQKFSD